MVDPMNEDTKHIKDQSMGTERYLEYINKPEACEPTGKRRGETVWNQGKMSKIGWK